MKPCSQSEMIFETGPSPMEYGARLNCPKLLALGSYRGLGFAVQNMSGKFPCAYVDVSGTSFESCPYQRLDVEVHGGLSYSGNEIKTVTGGWWLGWDYAHVGDLIFCKVVGGKGGCAKLFNGVQYTTEKIIEECASVIDQLLEKEKTGKPERADLEE